MTIEIADPDPDCDLCPRLVEFRHQQRERFPDWHNSPVDTWAPEDDNDVELLIAGLAPGLKGANCTGRPFTGDFAGDLLYATLKKFGYSDGEYSGLANDGLYLKRCAITNAVRCVPPANKPIGSEINACRTFLCNTLARFRNLKAIITLGKVSHDSVIRAMGKKVSQHPFGHCAVYEIAELAIISSYHCSRYNTNTGRLTVSMFEDVFAKAESLIRRTD